MLTMKNKLKIVLLISLAVIIAISSVCCKKEKEISRMGIHFTLLDEMEEREVSYANICYTNKDVELFINVFSREELDDREGIDLSEDISVQNFANTLIINMNYDAEYQYDAERDAAFFGADVYEDWGDVYCYYTVIRNYDYLYLIGMECDLGKKETYESFFESWAKSMYIDESITK